MGKMARVQLPAYRIRRKGRRSHVHLKGSEVQGSPQTCERLRERFKVKGVRREEAREEVLGRPLDVVFLHLAVQGAPGNFELPCRFHQVPVCFLKSLLNQGCLCFWKRMSS